MIKQFVPQEVCLKCTGCCRYKESSSVWLPCFLDEEIQVLLDGANVPPAAISADRKIRPLPAPDGKGFLCAFLENQTNKCKIYRFRPFECQLYPFLIALRGKRVMLTLDLNCPYISKNLNSKELKEYTQYLSEFLNSARQIRVLKDNPQIIQTYEDVLDVLELQI